MRFPRLSRSFLALAIVTGACSDSPTGPDKSLALDEVLNEMSLSTVLPGGIGGPAGLSASATVPTNCSYSASVQSFVCAPVTSRGITVTHGYTLLSASGTAQPAFDAGSTAAVRTTLSATGRTTVDQMATDIDMQQTMTLSGLLSRTHVLDGTQVLKMSANIVGAATIRFTSNTLVEGLVLPERGAASPYPRAGSITMTLVDADQVASGPLVMKMVFNGSSKVAVTITHGGITQRCTIDLAATGPGGSTCFAG